MLSYWRWSLMKNVYPENVEENKRLDAENRKREEFLQREEMRMTARQKKLDAFFESFFGRCIFKFLKLWNRHPFIFGIILSFLVVRLFKYFFS